MTLQEQEPSAVEGRRDRKKRETREALETAAWHLFDTQGYDATTVADITDEVDVAPRTFFRYFDSKEAVLFGDWRADLDEMAKRILDRPAAEGLQQAVAETLHSYSDEIERDRDIIRRRGMMAATSDHVGNYQRRVILPAWEDTMTAALAQRVDVDEREDFRPRLHASVAVSVIAAAMNHWLDAPDDVTLSEVVFECLAELGGNSAR